MLSTRFIYVHVKAIRPSEFLEIKAISYVNSMKSFMSLISTEISVSKCDWKLQPIRNTIYLTVIMLEVGKEIAFNDFFSVV